MHTWTRALRRRHVATRGWIGGALFGAAACAVTWWFAGAPSLGATAVTALLGGLAAAGIAEAAWSRRERRRALETLRAHRLRRAQRLRLAERARRRRRVAAALTPRTESTAA